MTRERSVVTARLESQARVGLCVALLLASSVLSGCTKKDDADETPKESPSTTPSQAVTPIDHLAPGELAPGKESAFGLVFPRQMKVDKRLGTAVFATGQPTPGAVATFVRARVHGGAIQALPDDGTLFEHVTAEDPKVQLSIRVEQDIQGSRLEVRDVTPPPHQDFPDDESRWRAAGLKPNGQPLDPTHLQ